MTRYILGEQLSAGGDPIFESQLSGPFVHADFADTYQGSVYADFTDSWALLIYTDFADAYHLLGPVHADFADSWALQSFDRVHADFADSWSGIVHADFSDVYALLGPVHADFTDSWALQNFDRVHADFADSWTGIVHADFADSWAGLAPVHADFADSWGLLGSVYADFADSWGLLGYNPVAADFADTYAFLGADPSVTLVASLYAQLSDGSRLRLQRASVGMDAGDLGWQATLVLANRTDRARVLPGVALTLVLYGREWALTVTESNVVESRTDNSVQHEVTVVAVSPAVVALGPGSATISTTFEQAIMAHAAVEQLLGQTVDWQVLDWQIPAGRLAFDNVTPAEAASRIVGAIKAVLESNRDGTLRVRSLSPIAIPQLPSASIDHTLTDRVIYRRRIQRQRQAVIDRLDIIDVVPVFQDRLEAEQDPLDWQKKIIRAYPSPWRSQLHIITSRGQPPVYLYAQGVVVREVVEMDGVENSAPVAFEQGLGRTRYPIMSVLSTEWLVADLGPLSFEPYTTTLKAAAPGYSLLNIRYLTRSLDYLAYSTESTTAQFLVEDLAS